MLQDLGDELRTPPNEYRRFIHKRIIGAVRGFGSGGLFGAATGFVTSGRSTRPTTRNLGQVPQRPIVGRVTTTQTRIGPFGLLGSQDRTVRSDFTIPPGTGRAVGELAVAALDARARGPVIPTADGCPKGFHLNKSSYNLKNGTHVPERSLCVKNRRRNNDNGTAALRAARRLIGRKNHQDTIDKALRKIAPAKRRSAPKAVPIGPHAHV